MKKLLVLTLVLGMASVANAALVLSVDGDTSKDEIDLFENDTAAIGICNTEAGGYDAFLAFGYVSEGGFELSGPTYVGPPGWPPPLQPDPIIIDDFIVYIIDFGFPPEPFPEFPPGIWVTIDLTCMSAGVDVFVELLKPATNILDTLIIHQVPEPMTITLLGLGGLLALRRRK